MYDEDHHNNGATDQTHRQSECYRLGFLAKDDDATMHLSPVGMGSLIDIVADDVNALPDVYAAGYKQGRAQTKTEV